LQNRDCSKALVAGINVILDPLPHIGLAETGMLSPDGRCKTLDSAADGYGRGEGVGLILLETVGEANKNSDNILCTVKT
ncbi:beta-ketoacyl synthase N-terminal-like domain-containing protein, partial [Klebsiella pneumoniae]